MGDVGRQTKEMCFSSLLYYSEAYLGSQYNDVQLVDNKFAFATMVRFKDVKANI